MTLRGRHIMVTGATGALGRVVTREVLREEAKVIAIFRSQEKFEALQQEVGDSEALEGRHVADLCDEAEVRKLFDQLDTLDALINIVGGFSMGAVQDTKWDDFQQMLDMNLKSAFLCSKNALPLLKRAGDGRIITIGAKSAFSGVAGMAAYSASKAALLNFTQSLAAEVGDDGITVNMVAPSIIDTEENREAMPEADFASWVSPVSIARTIVFLCSPAAAQSSGVAVPVFGKS